MIEPGAAFDLLAAYGDPSHAYVEKQGVGVTIAGDVEPVPVGDVARSLRERGGVAAGALPFEGEGALSVGSFAVWRTHEGVVRTVGEADGPFVRPAAAPPRAAFEPPQLHELPSSGDYARTVGEVVARIGKGELGKVVLARTIEVEAGRPLEPARLAHRLRAVNTEAWTFAMPAGPGVLVGASPELLVSREGLTVRSNPLAGSAPRSGDANEDRANAEALLASVKDREEHAFVVDAIAEVLWPICEMLRWYPQPVLLETPSVWHLSTRFEGRLKEPAQSVLELVQALHPTPAIAGTPRDEALKTIAEVEPFDRGVYAGPVGWMDARGDGAFAIALRCALLEGPRAILYSGAGIVAGSEPGSEVDETERKFRAFLEALRWG